MCFPVAAAGLAAGAGASLGVGTMATAAATTAAVTGPGALFSLAAPAATGLGVASSIGAGFTTATLGATLPSFSLALPGAAAAAGGMGSLDMIGKVFSMGSKLMGMGQENAYAKFAAAQAQRNAQLARFYADSERETGDAEARQHALKVKELIARQAKGFAVAGVVPTEGSPLDIQAETAQFGSADARTIRANAERKARAHELRAGGFEQEASMTLSSMTSPILGSALTLMEAALPVASKWYTDKSAAFNPMV